jgi:hypothetical protein
MRDSKENLVARGGVWPWLIARGPHGPSFEWGQTPGTPHDFRCLELLRTAIAEQTAGDESFPSEIRNAALELLATDDSEFIRRGLQVLSVVGNKADNEFVKSFLEHPDANIRKDARASLFERGVKLKVTA